MSSLLKLAQVADIKPVKANEIIGEVIKATSKWQFFAEKAQVSIWQTKSIAQALLELQKLEK